VYRNYDRTVQTEHTESIGTPNFEFTLGSRLLEVRNQTRVCKSDVFHCLHPRKLRNDSLSRLVDLHSELIHELP